MSERQGDSLQHLVGNAIAEGIELARREFGLFKAEMAHNIAGLAKGGVMFAAAAIFGIASLIWLTQALVYGIDYFIHAIWLSALIVGILLLVIAGLLVMAGMRMLSAASLEPTRTIHSLKRDGEILTERVSG